MYVVKNYIDDLQNILLDNPGYYETPNNHTSFIINILINNLIITGYGFNNNATCLPIKASS